MRASSSSIQVAARSSAITPMRTLASHAYLRPSSHPGSSSPSPIPQPHVAASSASTSAPPSSASSSISTSSSSTSQRTIDATTSTPLNLTPKQKDLLSRIIRVDQAGELGANWIYRGQKFSTSFLKSDTKTAQQIEEMWATEKHHLNVMSLLQSQHRIRPTMLYPVWRAMAWGLGAGTAAISKEAAMACTEAVETIIGEHYDDQLKELNHMLESYRAAGTEPHPSLTLLKEILTEFRDDELEHLDTAVEEGAQKAPGHSLLSAIIGVGCKAAIKVCEKI